MKKLIKEFKEFISRGNVLDLAVGVIIGAAFKDIINSLVSDIIMPIITLLTGKTDFSNLFISLDGNTYATLDAAKEAGAATLNYGTFISMIINFLLMSVVIFALIKVMNSVAKLGKKPEIPATPTTKICPYCQSEVAIAATRCPHCTSELESEEK